MSSTDILIDQLFTTPVNMLDGFISTDLAWVSTAIITILCILMVASKIYQIMNRSSEEVLARRSFDDWRSSRGTWKESLYRKKYMEYLKEYDERETNV
jgi:hypothetical protein